MVQRQQKDIEQIKQDLNSLTNMNKSFTQSQSLGTELHKVTNELQHIIKGQEHVHAQLTPKRASTPSATAGIAILKQLMFRKIILFTFQCTSAIHYSRRATGAGTQIAV